MSKAWALTVTVIMTLAILLPIHEDFRGVRGDSFPFSWYPMFSRPRPDPDWAHYVVGRGDQHRRVLIPSRYYVKGSMNQARRQLDTLVRSEKTAKETCERAAARVARSRHPEMLDVRSLRVVRGFFHMEEYFGKRNKEPMSERTYARCRVKREPEVTEVDP